MKTLLSLLLIITLSNLTIAQTTAIPDADFEQALINLGLDMGNPDGTVITANIDTLTSLDISFQFISDLTGIEDFVGLTTLECRFNLLTSIDLSNNTALTHLFCLSNQLTSLDLSNNTALVFLDCWENNLTSLDLSNNIVLETLECDFNQLTNLDVSNNIALTSLNCGVNELTNLDINNNTALINLDCSRNQLTTLNVSNNIALTSLDCGVNPLSSIDLSNNIALNYLSCDIIQLTNLDLSNNTALTGLSCSENQLTNLDVTNNTLLTSLICDDNQLTSLNISNNTALANLYCTDNLLTCLNIKNGNNNNFVFFNATGNPNLTCITVDDVAYSNSNWLNIDTQTSFSTNCGNACSTVGIEENIFNKLSIYPNPTLGEISIDLGESVSNLKATIINSLGQVIQIQNYSSTNLIELNIDVPKGLYFLQIETRKGEVITKKIILE